MNTNFGIGVYKKEDYLEILNLSEDREKMDLTWEEWKINKDNTAKKFLALGIVPIDILVLPIELVLFCRENGLPVNGTSRASFVSKKVKEADEKKR